MRWIHGWEKPPSLASEGTRVVSKAVILLFTYKFELAAQPIDAL